MNDNQLEYIKALLLAMRYHKELSYMNSYCEYMEKVGQLMENAINRKNKYKQQLTSQEIFDSLIYIKTKRGLYGMF